VLSALVVLGGTVFGSPAIGAALLVFAFGATFAPRSRILATAVSVVPLAALVAAVAFVAVEQWRSDYAHDAQWPSHFGSAHALVLFAFLALALVIWSERDEDLRFPKQPDPGPD
jgi:hypothetical protein